MTETCRYFDSDEWEERLKRHVGRVWNDKDLSEAVEDIDVEETTGKEIEDISDLNENDVLRIWKENTGEHGNLKRVPKECPHEARENGLCIFHAPVDRKNDKETKNEFLKKIEQKGRENKKFVGAEFGQLDLEQEILDSDNNNHPIDLSFAEIEKLEMNDTTVKQVWHMDRSTVSKEAYFMNAKFNRFSSFGSTEFGDKSNFAHVKFRNIAHFEGAEFKENTVFGHADFGKSASFIGAEFNSKVDFRRVEVRGNSVFSHVVFGEESDFSYAAFGGESNFSFATFEDGGVFRSAVFRGKSYFNDARFQDDSHDGLLPEPVADFSRVKFKRGSIFIRVDFVEDASFIETEFGGSSRFGEGSFEGHANFRYAEFDGKVNFANTDFKKDAVFLSTDFKNEVVFLYAIFHSNVLFANAKLNGVVFAETESFQSEIDLKNTIVHDGEIIQPEDSSTFYDFTEATIGNVDFHEENCGHNLFDYFRFYRTDFDGFDFTDYKDGLGSKPEIHEFGHNSDYEQEETPAGLEATYLKAKDGAKKVGDHELASKFFVKEMQYRRDRYKHEIENDRVGWKRRIKLEFKRGINWLYEVTSGYGEKPRRVIETAVLVVFFFAFLYPLDGIRRVQDGSAQVLTYGSANSFAERLDLLLESFYFSAVTFTTLGYVDLQPVGYSHALSVAESATGALLIALLIFVFGRSVKW